MKKAMQIIFVLSILIFTSCKRNEDDYIFENVRFENMDKLSINEVIKTEKEIGSKERNNNNNTFGLSQDYYPNKNGFELSYPKVFERNQKELGLETDYFCSAKDGLIKVIFYEWNSKYWNLDGFKRDTLKNVNVSERIIYQNKFNNLRENIIKKLGKATEINIEKHKDTSYNYSDNCEWIKNDLNVSLSLNVSGDSFRQIRLVIHKK